MFNKVLTHYFSAYAYIQDVLDKSNKFKLKTKTRTK